MDLESSFRPEAHTFHHTTGNGKPKNRHQGKRLTQQLPPREAANPKTATKGSGKPKNRTNQKHSFLRIFQFVPTQPRVILIYALS